MARRIQHQRSSVAGAVPDPSAVLVGELIVNLADRTLRTKNGANALIRINQHALITDTEPVDPFLGDFYITTSGQIRAYYNPGAGLTWYNIAAPEDLSGYLAKSGGIMTGQITLPGGGGNTQALQKSEIATLIAAAVGDYLLKAGGTMTGQITLPGGGTANQALRKSEIEALITAAIPPDLSNVLLKAGGTMTGQITLPGGGSGNQAASANDIAAAVSAHSAQPDPHTGYTLTAELNAVIATMTAHTGAGGAVHALATTSVAGFMSAADKVKVDALPAVVTITEVIMVAVGDETTAITVGVAKISFRMPYAFTLTSVKASLNVASSSGIPTVDINEAGATVLTTKLTIDATELTSVTAATPAVIGGAGPALAADALMTIDIDVAGTGAKGLKVYLIGNQ